MRANLILWLFTVVVGFSFGSAALAQDSQSSTPTQQSTSSTFNTIRKNTSANYTLWVTGATLGAMDGTAGDGHSITMNQFLNVGYKLTDKWKVSLTQYFTNKLRSDSKGDRNLNFFDPYVTFSNSSLTKSSKYNSNLSFYVRYYMPFSHESADNIGKARDQKYGKIRVKVGPTKKFMDGALTLSGSTYFYKPLAGAQADDGTSSQRDFYIWFYPSLSYELSKSFQPYMAYSNLLNHFRNDKGRNGGSRWSKWSQNESVEFGFNWQPLANLDVNPYIEFAGPKWIIGETNVGLVLDYSFL